MERRVTILMFNTQREFKVRSIFDNDVCYQREPAREMAFNNRRLQHLQHSFPSKSSGFYSPQLR